MLFGHGRSCPRRVALTPEARCQRSLSLQKARCAVRNRSLMFVGVLALTFAVGTCKGDNGGTGPTGPAGSAGSAGPAGLPLIMCVARINKCPRANKARTFLRAWHHPAFPRPGLGRVFFVPRIRT